MANRRNNAMFHGGVRFKACKCPIEMDSESRVAIIIVGKC